MKLNKIQQKIFNHQLKYNLNNKNYNDSNKTIAINFNKKELFNTCVSLFINEPLCIEPAKTIVVSIIYSLLLEKHFNISFYDSLENPFLLSYNSKFFKTYSSNKKIYKKLLKFFGKNNILILKSKSIEIISTYFYNEFNGLI